MVMLHIKLERIKNAATWQQRFCPQTPTPPPPPPTLRIESVGQNSHFQNMVMLHIKLKGSTNFRSMVAKILPADTYPPPHPPPPNLRVGSKKSKINFFRTWSCCILNKRESRMQQHGSKYFARNPPTLGIGPVG